MCRSELKSLGCLGLHLSVVTVGIFSFFLFFPVFVLYLFLGLRIWGLLEIEYPGLD